MKKITLVSLALSSTLIACGGGDPKSASSKPDSLLPDGYVPPSSASSSSSSASNIVNQAIPYHENFDAANNTRSFFSVGYKALNTDATLPFYFATGGFLDELGNPSPTATSWITADANRKLRIGNGRLSLGQTRLEVNTTTADTSIPTWGEFDLSKAYTVSFCVVEVSTPSSSNFELYVDNNTTSGNNSIYGAGNASRILQVATHTLVPGERRSVTVPAAGAPLIGSKTSFFQFRVSSGGYAVIDDLVVEYADQPHSFNLPACVAETTTAPAPEVAPSTPDAPTVLAGDTQITVTWPSVGLDVTYELAYNTVDSAIGATAFAGNPISGTSATIEQLTNGQPYYIFLRAKNVIGTSEYSASATATPEAPTGVDGDYTWGFNPEAYKAVDGLFSAAYSDSGNNNISTSELERSADGVLLFLNSGTALRFRGNDNKWNYNGHSWSDGSSTLTPEVGAQAPGLRAYVGFPVDSGRAVTLEVDFTQTGSSVNGKIVMIGSDNTVLASKAAPASSSDTISISLPVGHKLSHIKVIYSREGDSSGGVNIGPVRKIYTAAAGLLSENFDLADATNFFTIAYKTLPDDAAAPFYVATSGGSRITFADGALSMTNARFTLGDKGGATSASAQPNGVLDLSKPYRLSFTVTAAAGTGNFQVYVDNNTTSAGNSIHSAISSTASRLLQTAADSITTFPHEVVIESDVGTATSFFQIRADSSVTNLTIDNIKLEYQ